MNNLLVWIEDNPLVIPVVSMTMGLAGQFITYCDDKRRQDMTTPLNLSLVGVTIVCYILTLIYIIVKYIKSKYLSYNK